MSASNGLRPCGFNGSRDISDPWKQSILEHARRDGLAHFRIARRIVGDTASAEDVCQQTYLKALLAEDSIEDPGKIAGWLTRVITNESLDTLRRRKRQHTANESYEATTWRDLNADNPHERSENREYVALLLARLEEPIRTVVVMRTMQGMTGNEVKQALGCSAGLVSRRLHKGLEQLRQWMIEENRGKEARL